MDITNNLKFVINVDNNVQHVHHNLIVLHVLQHLNYSITHVYTYVH